MVTVNHKMASSQRKGNRSPKVAGTQLNDYAVGKQRAIKLVAFIEREGHRSMIAQLRMVQRTAKLTEFQLCEVNMELGWRLAKCKELCRIIENAQRCLDLQFSKPGAFEQSQAVSSIVPVPSTNRLQSEKRRKQYESTTKLTPTGLIHTLDPRCPQHVEIKLEVRQQAWIPTCETPQPSSLLLTLSPDSDTQ